MNMKTAQEGWGGLLNSLTLGISINWIYCRDVWDNDKYKTINVIKDIIMM